MKAEIVTRDKKSNFQIIQSLFEGKLKENELTVHQFDYLRRVRSAYGMMLEAKSNAYIIGRLMETFEISHSQAWRMVRETERLFGNMKKTNKEIKRHIAEEMAKEAFRIAKQRGDTKAMVSAIRAYSEATGINIEDPDLPDFAKLDPSLVIMVLPEEDASILKNLLKGGVLDLNQLPNETVDIEHEEIDEPGSTH